jgi:hypothetical protein
VTELDDESSPRGLWAAVLLHAVRDLTLEATPLARQKAAEGHNFSIGYVRSVEAIRFDATEWVASDEYRVGSFTWVCMMLDLDHEVIRERARKVSIPRGPRRKSADAGIPPAL